MRMHSISFHLCCVSTLKAKLTFAFLDCSLVVKPLESLFLRADHAGQAPRSAVVPDGGSLDPVSCVFGVKCMGAAGQMFVPNDRNTSALYHVS